MSKKYSHLAVTREISVKLRLDLSMRCITTWYLAIRARPGITHFVLSEKLRVCILREYLDWKI